MPIEDIAKVLDKGEPILVFDDSQREGETDIFFSARHVTPASVRFLRKQGGDDSKEAYEMAQKAHSMSKEQMKMMLERETGPTDRFSSSFG